MRKLFDSYLLIYYHPIQLDCMARVQIHLHRYTTILYHAIRKYNVAYVWHEMGSLGVICRIYNYFPVF